MAQIKKDTSLRKAILQAAITGQLISNVEGITETGNELLDKIIEERNNKLLAEWEDALKKNPKTKKPAPVVASEIDEEEIPFEIPENWCWCRWGELSDSIQYGFNAPAKESGRIKMVRITDIQNGKVQWNTVPFCEISEEEIITYKLRKNDILFARTGGTVGKSFLVDEEPENAVYAGYLIRTQYNSEKLNPKYMKMFMESQLYWDQLKNGTIATAQPNCNGQTLSKMILPLPPLAVQNAIVAKLDQVLPLVDAYENAILQKEELKNALPDKVKKAILQEAITGQLTEAWRKSATIKENGKQLLDRIIEERNAKALADWKEALKKNPKAKKPVPVVASEIEEEEIPFEVPENWCWCRLGDVIDLLSGRDLEPSAYNSISKGIPYMTGASNFDNEELIVNRWTDKPATISNLGDLLITCKGTIGELAFNKVGDVHIARQIMAIRKTEYINLKFLRFFLMSRIDEIQKQAKSMIPGISREDMLGFEFPLPPLEEQEKIVDLVESLIPYYEII